MSKVQFSRLLSIRCQLATSNVSDSPLVWLNSCVELASESPDLIPVLHSQALDVIIGLRERYLQVRAEQLSNRCIEIPLY